MTIDFIKDKETKNTIRFTASGEVQGSVYIPKDSELAKRDILSVELAEEAPAEEAPAKEAEVAEASA